jgi:hypothetical protein
MKRLVILLLCFLMGMGILMYSVLFEKGVDAKTPERQFAQEVLKSDWDGKWKCNLDGRIAEVEFSYESDEDRVFGYISDSGGERKAFGERKLYKSDLLSSRRDHMLPLLYDGKVKWMLIVATHNTNHSRPQLSRF